MIQLKKGKIFTEEFILLGFLFFLSLLMHFLFSWAGFNPTDDGLILASSRRILNGEVPYKDFISIRPIGSALLNLPLVALAGDYTFWLSRFFTLIEFALISWAWVLITRRMLKLKLNMLESILFGIVAFTFSSHNFPIMSSPTVDGLFFISFGFLPCLSKNKILKFLGYFLIGYAYLCKQNFLIIGPMAIFMLGDIFKFSSYLAVITPAFIYLIFLLLNRAFFDFIIQISSHTDFIKAGILRYLQDRKVFYGFLLGLTIAFFLSDNRGNLKIRNFKKIIGILITFGTIFYCVGFLKKDIYDYFSSPSFILFSVIFGIVIFLIFQREKVYLKFLSLGLFIILLAWSVSLSIGYNSPALTTGLLAIFLLAFERSMISLSARNYFFNKLSTVLLVIVSFMALRNNIQGRKNYVYRDKPRVFLTKPIDQVISGTKFIKTNENTYVFLLDLKKAIGKAEIMGKDYVIIPELAAFWVQSKNQNPLSIDWPSPVEIGNQKNLVRVFKRLDDLKGKNLILVQKISTALLPSGFKQRKEVEDDYEILQYVRKNFKRVDKTEFFEIYN